MGVDVLLQAGVQAGIINLAGFAVTIAGIVLVAAWWAYLYR
jgi:hypothetical protein